MSKILSAALAASLAFTFINAQGYAAMKQADPAISTKTSMSRVDALNFTPSKNTKFVSQTVDDAPQKVNSVDIYVSNLYSASGGMPNYVRVYDAIDGLLMENNVESLQKAIKIIEDAPGLVAPSTLMTVAARAFDLGLKDEAAFWFYAGKNRFIVFTEVLDVKDPVFASTMDVNLAFVKLVGDVINPYAFCDLKKQRAAVSRANEWTKAHPYEAVFLERFPSKFKDRKAALKNAESLLEKSLQKQDEYFADPKNKEEFFKKRKQNRADERFCD